MINFTEQFGYQIFGDTMGEAWLELVECVLKNGNLEFDEKRARFALQHVRVRAGSQCLPDTLFDKYGNHENIQSMIGLVFEHMTMKDMDITPSFREGAKSYCARIKEGRMVEFVVKRLTEIPESKKAVIVFPTYEDYSKVLNTPFNDYLPCIVSLQFRLRPNADGTYFLNTVFNMRSQDVYQKCASDLIVFAMLTEKIADQLSESLKTKVMPGLIDGMITDAHVYQNTSSDAQLTVMKYLDDHSISKMRKNESFNLISTIRAVK